MYMVKKKGRSRRAKIPSFMCLVKKTMLITKIKNMECIAVVMEGEGTEKGHCFGACGIWSTYGTRRKGFLGEARKQRAPLGAGLTLWVQKEHEQAKSNRGHFWFEVVSGHRWTTISYGTQWTFRVSPQSKFYLLEIYPRRLRWKGLLISLYIPFWLSIQSYLQTADLSKCKSNHILFLLRIFK